MRTLPVPPISAEASYIKSISRVRDAALKQRLASITSDVVAAANELAAAAVAGAVDTIPTAAAVGPVSGAELKAVYRDRFAKDRAPGRIYYDRIITSAPNGKCPMCGHRDVATLDHFLPQAKYPALTVAPVNLVPACSDCNKTKLDRRPTSPSTVTLHPYFDDIESQPWLTAAVQETAPASTRFWVNPPAEWSPVLVERVIHHFRVFGLARLYAAQAAEELVNIRSDLTRVFAAEGNAGVAAFLRDRAASRRAAHINSWQTATYDAFAASPWFCDQGFALT
jgi:hypothetical protein